jgi:hypothetical protein
VAQSSSLLIATFAAILAQTAFAQVTTTGEIHGTVADQSGVVPNVHLKPVD